MLNLDPNDLASTLNRMIFVLSSILGLLLAANLGW